MRKYNEMIAEFAAVDDTGRTLWLKDLPLDELKTFREGLDKNAIQLIKHWIPYIDEVISDKIKELRNSKLISLFNDYQQKFC